MEQGNISELTKKTAQNIFELMTQLAQHIEKLEAENAELRSQLQEQPK